MSLQKLKNITSKQLSNDENQLVDKSKQLSNRYHSPATHPSTPFNDGPTNTPVEHRNAPCASEIHHCRQVPLASGLS
jgi:hypothetical protein